MLPPDSAGADSSPRGVPEAAVRSPEPRTFLTAEWRHLLMLNYAADPRILRPHVPRGTELDDWSGTTYLSIVGFMFLKTRVLGLPIPWHRSFTEVNLRFYVRRRAAEGWRSGVVFLKEIVPRRAVAAIARLCYNEPYVNLPMSHHAEVHGRTLVPGSVLKYSWQHEARWCSVAGRVAGPPEEPSAESEARFITEHYWGYSTRRGGGTSEYQVTHAPWRVTDAIEPRFAGDVASLYGVQYTDALAGPPRSAFIASGSPVRVGAGARIA
jgi:uncharacterized protein YqjF (DUF2071 family)